MPFRLLIDLNIRGIGDKLNVISTYGWLNRENCGIFELHTH